MLISYVSDSFPTEYVPTVFDNYQANVMVEGRPISLGLWDTAGQEDYDRLRPLSYPGTDVFIVSFSVIANSSLDNVKAKWLPEIRNFCPDSPFILVGTKSDLRGDRSFMDARPGTQFVDPAKAMAMAEELQAAKLPTGDGKMKTCCLECSAKSQDGLKAVFDTAIQVALMVRQEKMKKKKKTPCAVL